MNIFKKLFNRKKEMVNPADEPLKPLNFDNIPNYRRSSAPKVCAKCHRTEQKVREDFEAARGSGVIVIGDLNRVLLYCDNCNKYFCGACQIDLGYDSGCPICNKALD